MEIKNKLDNKDSLLMVCLISASKTTSDLPCWPVNNGSLQACCLGIYWAKNQNLSKNLNLIMV